MKKRLADTRTESIYRFLKTYIQERGWPPSMREIGEACGVSSMSMVSFYLRRLEKLGSIKRQKGQARGIQIAA
jgi:repressor LexA